LCDTIQYSRVYLTCSKKLTDSQLSPPHGTNKKLKYETKNKMMSVIGPVQSLWCECSNIDTGHRDKTVTRRALGGARRACTFGKVVSTGD